MGNPRAFLTIHRQEAGYRPVHERIDDFSEVEQTLNSGDRRTQASRCMDCGVPFCHWACPLGNKQPEWQDLLYKGRYKEAYHVLEQTDDFPEFTGRVCPALCEKSCVLKLSCDEPVTIRENEAAIVEAAFREGYVQPIQPVRNGKKVAVIGSGPAGLTVANQLNRKGYEVTVFEKDELPGGLLRFGIPNFKLGKHIIELKKWVNYALANDVLIMYDSAYEAYIQDPNIPHSIYEIKGAKKVAIEFRSFSKTAGFTGIRCGYTVVPKELNAFTLDGQRVQLNKLWNRRQCTKFNGTSYITQRGAEAVYSTAGKQQVTATINYYMTNAKIMKEGLQNCGLTVYGGDNAPYLWLKTPDGLSSWKFFDKLLYEVKIVGTPGVGFGPSGEGYLRLTAFGDRDDTLEAMARLRKWLR